MKSITIAIDGYSSCGKSTLAKAMARTLSYVYIDTGAMYRAVTLYFLRNAVDWNDPQQVDEALQQIEVSFQVTESGNRTLLNGEDVEDDIRQMEISEYVSPVSAVPAVRRAMVALQRRMGAAKGVVMDGRDIGTVVFPDAELKLFVTADTEERVRRRYTELINRNQNVSRDEVRHNLLERDRIDSTREDSPLRQADDAVVIDNSHLTQAQQLDLALELVRDRMRHLD